MILLISDVLHEYVIITRIKNVVHPAPHQHAAALSQQILTKTDVINRQLWSGGRETPRGRSENKLFVHISTRQDSVGL